MLNQQARPVWVEINKANIAHNLERVSALSPNAKRMAVIKADGYGHGMLEAANALAAADEFGVNSVDDVKRLRAAGITKACSLFAPLIDLDTLRYCSENKVRPTIFDQSHFAHLDSLNAERNSSLDLWLKVDTGMGRIGFAPQETPLVLERLEQIDCVGRVHLMSHFASADDINAPLNAQQIERFSQLSTLTGVSDVSLLNSAGVVSFAEHSYDIVRPGVMLYGISPSQHIDAQGLELKPAMNFNARIISIKTVPAGHGIGYASTFVAPEDMRIAVIAAGYGDGYPRHAPNGTPVSLNGETVSLIGRVSMDMLVVDLRGVDANGVSVEIGDTAQLWGDKNPVETVAAHCGTIAYELTCGILPRVERRCI